MCLQEGATIFHAESFLKQLPNASPEILEILNKKNILGQIINF